MKLLKTLALAGAAALAVGTAAQAADNDWVHVTNYQGMNVEIDAAHIQPNGGLLLVAQRISPADGEAGVLMFAKVDCAKQRIRVFAVAKEGGQDAMPVNLSWRSAGNSDLAAKVIGAACEMGG
jgi:hypothetical protein